MPDDAVQMILSVLVLTAVWIGVAVTVKRWHDLDPAG